MSMRRLSLTIVLLGAILLLGFDPAHGQRSRSSKTITRREIATVTVSAPGPKLPPETQRRFDTFVQVWETIKTNYYDPTFNNLDWEKIRLEFEPLAKAAKSDAELHDLLNRMLGRLGKSHLVVIPPEIYSALENTKRAVKAREKAMDPVRSSVAGDEGSEDDLDLDLDTAYGIGVELSLLDDRFVITRMDPNSAAEYAGLKRGYVIEKVNGVSLQQMLDRILAYQAAITSYSVKQFIPAEVVSWILNGDRDSFVAIGYLDENNEAKEVRIRREPLKERTMVIAPNFPRRQLSFEWRELNDQVGYIRFNMFAIPVIEKFCEAVGKLRSKQGLIIDLRGNTGGLLATLPILAGMLTNSEIALGSTIYRTRSEPLKAPAKKKNFTGRLVFLVDDRTASAAEIFALAMRENGRAMIVGQHTSGMALPSIIVRLATGATFMYPFANYRSVSGKTIEGNGIVPDRSVGIDRKSLLEGRDVQLDLAKTVFEDATAFNGIKPVPAPATDPVLGAGKGDYIEPPPPMNEAPPPSKEMKLSILAAPNSSTPEPLVKGQDEKSKEYIASFLKNVGGRDALASIAAMAIKGSAELKALGTSSFFEFRAYRVGQDKFAEYLHSDATGEIREIVNGKAHFLQTDFGIDQDLSAVPQIPSPDIFSLITDLATSEETYPSLAFKGVFDREERKTAVLSGRSKDGKEVGLAFDVATGMLVNVTKGFVSVSFGDYRKTGELMLPYKIEHTGVMTITIDDIRLNESIPMDVFSKKERCYDKNE